MARDAAPVQYRPGGRGLYRLLVILGSPLRWWVRLRIDAAEVLPTGGGVLLVSNHDSWLDPLALAAATMHRGRPLRFLAKSTLWNSLPIRLLLDGIRQIPIRRGRGDAAAMDVAVQALDQGEVVGIFPEGTLSRGTRLRARSGVSRLAQAAPQATVVLAEVTGGTDLIRFPKRPRVRVAFFLPERGQPRPDEAPAELAARLMDEIRVRVPPVPNGRRPAAVPVPAAEATAAAASAEAESPR